MKSFFSLIKPKYQFNTLAKPTYSSYFLNKRFYVANAASIDHGIKAAYPYPNSISKIVWDNFTFFFYIKFIKFSIYR
jgi:hypothetical protein